jgi:hypothetical protein
MITKFGKITIENHSMSVEGFEFEEPMILPNLEILSYLQDVVASLLKDQVKALQNGTKEMIKKRDHLNEVYYVSHVFNQMILSQFKIGVYSIDQSNYNKLGTPEEIEKYIQKLDIHNG